MRQLNILFKMEVLKEFKLRSSSLALCLSFVKIMDLFHSRGRLSNLNLIQRTETVFMFLFWQVAAVYPKIAIAPADFGSSVPRDPFSFYYDPEKSTWLEWVTLHEYHRNNSHIDLVS
jgi:hypothetical protein